MTFTVGVAQAGTDPSELPVPTKTTPCPDDITQFVNGSFENFTNPDDYPLEGSTDSLKTGPVSGVPVNFGEWVSFAGGPAQILFLNPGAVPLPGEVQNSVTGWQTNATYLEIQRQVIATSSTLIANNSGSYWDRAAPQPADGTFWAELAANDPAALFQEVTVPSDARLFWSLKHRGRTNSNPMEKMRVLIGPAGETLGDANESVPIAKFTPSNADVFSGEPVFNDPPTVPSEITGTLSGGWQKFVGTVDPSGGSVDDSMTLQFRFEAVRGALAIAGSRPNGFPSFGNLLDDIEFFPFIACPANRTVNVGETVEVDVTGPLEETMQTAQNGSPMMSYGDGQELADIGNATAPENQFSFSGNTISFTPLQAGTFSIDYLIEMSIAGTTYKAVSRISYEVADEQIVDEAPGWRGSGNLDLPETA